MDHMALTHLFTQKDLNPMMQMWIDDLLDMPFDLVHLPGIKNVLPDILSRLYASTPLPREFRTHLQMLPDFDCLAADNCGNDVVGCLVLEGGDAHE